MASVRRNHAEPSLLLLALELRLRAEILQKCVLHDVLRIASVVKIGVGCAEDRVAVALEQARQLRVRFTGRLLFVQRSGKTEKPPPYIFPVRGNALEHEVHLIYNNRIYKQYKRERQNAAKFFYFPCSIFGGGIVSLMKAIKHQRICRKRQQYERTNLS